jgi:hypothetical protein
MRCEGNEAGAMNGQSKSSESLTQTPPISNRRTFGFASDIVVIPRDVKY